MPLIIDAYLNIVLRLLFLPLELFTVLNISDLILQDLQNIY